MVPMSQMCEPSGDRKALFRPSVVVISVAAAGRVDAGPGQAAVVRVHGIRERPVHRGRPGGEADGPVVGARERDDVGAGLVGHGQRDREKAPPHEDAGVSTTPFEGAVGVSMS